MRLGGIAPDGDLNSALTFGVMESGHHGKAAPNMVYAFDTLGYAKRLRDAGVLPEQAEAHAEAAREFVMGELVTRHDLDMSTALLQRDFEASISGLRRDFEGSIAGLRREIEASIAGLRIEIEGSIAGLRREIEGSITGLRTDLEPSIAGVRRDLEALRSDMQRLELRLIIRLGGMLAVGIAILAAIIKF